MKEQKDLKKQLNFYYNRAKKLEPFSCPIKTKNPGAIGIEIQNKIMPNAHNKNKADIPNLVELKSKNIKSNGTLSLAKYNNPKSTFNNTFNKVKDNLMLIYWKKLKNKIHPIKIELYSKLDKSLFAIYCSEVRRKAIINCTVQASKLKVIYNKHKIYYYEKKVS